MPDWLASGAPESVVERGQRMPMHAQAFCVLYQSLAYLWSGEVWAVAHQGVSQYEPGVDLVLQNVWQSVGGHVTLHVVTERGQLCAVQELGPSCGVVKCGHSHSVVECGQPHAVLQLWSMPLTAIEHRFLSERVGGGVQQSVRRCPTVWEYRAWCSRVAQAGIHLLLCDADCCCSKSVGELVECGRVGTLSWGPLSSGPSGQQHMKVRRTRRAAVLLVLLRYTPAPKS